MRDVIGCEDMCGDRLCKTYVLLEKELKKTLKIKKRTPFCILVILCEKRLKNTLSIREMISF